MDTRPEPEPQPSPKGDALVKGTLNNSSPRQPPGADSAFPQPSLSVDSKLIDRLDNGPSTSGLTTQRDVTQTPPQRQKRQRELEEIQSRKWERGLEVQCDPHYFQQNISPILSQKEKRRRELEREKKRKEVRGQRQRELEREKEKEAREHKVNLEVRATLLLLTGLE